MNGPVTFARILLGRRPADRALQWRGNPPGALLPLVRVAHFGDCGWRSMPRSHGIHTWPGYPHVMSERLREAGLATEFSSVIAHRFEHLPSHDPTYHLRLSGEPDVILIGLGAAYHRLVVLPDAHRVVHAREQIGRALGERVFDGYRLVDPFVGAFGRFAAPYDGAGGLERFLAVVRQRWPGAPAAVLLPFPWLTGSRRQVEVDRRVRADVALAAARAGLPALDFADLLAGGGADLRCANGYNLNDRGSLLVGERLARWVAERVPVPSQELSRA